MNTLRGRSLANPFLGEAPPDVVDATSGLLSPPCCELIRGHEESLLRSILGDRQAADPDKSVYTGGPGVAFFLVKAAAMRGEPWLLEEASSFLAPRQEQLRGDAEGDPALGCSLLCGYAGWLCVDALRSHTEGDYAAALRAAHAFGSLAATAESPAMGDNDEWLYGRAGFLHGCLLLRHVCGPGSVSSAAVDAVSDRLLAVGVENARRDPCGPPLVWRWQGKQYLGAAHGYMGIVFMLLHVESVMQDPQKSQLLLATMDWLLSQRVSNGNWPAVRGGAGDFLVHFCHGAPGMVHLLCKAYEVLGESWYLQEAESAGDLVWRHGMLKKGPSLCHGFAGNGYVFLALFRASRDPLWLSRAYCYATTMLRPDVMAQCRTPDNPMSLFEGAAGAACFLLDLRLSPMTSALPLYEVSWLRRSPAPLLGAGDEPLSVMLHNQCASAPTDYDLDESELESIVTGAISDISGIDGSEIDPFENQLVRSMHSMMIVAFDRELEGRLERSQRGKPGGRAGQRRVRPRLAFDHPTVKSMVLCLMNRCHCLMCRTDRRRPVEPALQRHDTVSSEDLSEDHSPEALVLPVPRLALFTQQVSLVNLAEGCAYVAQGQSRYARATDGMTCIEVPGAVAWIGEGLGERAALAVERPCHEVQLQSFMMDIEPVSVGAFARFLSLVQPGLEIAMEWLAQDAAAPFPTKRCPLEQAPDGCWVPRVPETWPMINVTWFGANAYSLWANGEDWWQYRDATSSFLPSEAQWEYAARGASPANFPWGDAAPTPALLNVNFTTLEPPDIHQVTLQDLPLADVNCELGVSPFGLRHMAGNVWQWCRDTYSPEFYASEAAALPDAWNDAAGGPKAERGGSWVGPAQLARSSYRRGRDPMATGPCLGFRCIGAALSGDAQ